MKEKNRAFFVPFILSKGIFFDVCVLSQYVVYWIHFQNIHTFIYQKALLHTLFALFLKSVGSLQSILNNLHLLYFIEKRKLFFLRLDLVTPYLVVALTRNTRFRLRLWVVYFIYFKFTRVGNFGNTDSVRYPDNCPQENCPPVRVGIWVKVRVN